MTRLFLKKGFTLVQWEYHYTKGTTTAAEAVATNRHNWPIASNPTSNWTILFSYCCSLTDRLHHFWWFRDSERSCTLADWDTRQQIKQPLPAPAFACFGLQGHLNESHEVVWRRDLGWFCWNTLQRSFTQNGLRCQITERSNHLFSRDYTKESTIVNYISRVVLSCNLRS